MGDHKVHATEDLIARSQFSQHLLNDIAALELLLKNQAIESLIALQFILISST